MTKVLVTGAGGFIGSHLINLLSEQQISVRAFILPNKNLKQKRSSVEVVHGDIRDAKAVDQAVQGCDKIYHLAAYCNLWSRDHHVYQDVNVGGTKNICGAAKKHGVTKFVYTSTCETMNSPPRKKMADEQDWSLSGRNVGPYAKSKRMAEKIVTDYQNEGRHAVIVHPTLPVGPGDDKPSPVGEMIQLFLRRKMKMYYPTGFNFVNVKDVAYGHYLAGEKGLSGEHYILGGQNLSFEAFLQKLEVFTDIPAPVTRTLVISFHNSDE